MKSVVSNFRAMGTDISVEIVADNQESANQAINQVKDIFTSNEKIFSRFSQDSELSKINSNLGKETEVSPKMVEVLELCLKFYSLSGGIFDPRIIGNLEKIGYSSDFKTGDFNSNDESEIELEKIEGDFKNDLKINNGKILAKKRVDTTGIAKGYTVDEAARYLEKNSFENFVVDAGGDMYARGKDKDGKAWKIGIEGLEENKILLKLENEGIATSGISRKRWAKGSRKFHHLINPKAPENFSFDIKTVTVIENKTVEADGRAKVLVLLGKEKGLEFANTKRIKALFLDYRGNVYLSEAMKANLVE